MNIVLKIIFQLFVTLQIARSQTIVALAPQSSCSNNIYFDYIANAKILQKQLIISGELVTTADSILQIEVALEKSNAAFNMSSNETTEFLIEKIKWQQKSWLQFFYCNKIKNLVVLRPNNLKVIEKNEVTIYANLSEKITLSAINKNVELLLVCTATFKNGCKYIKKQKIIFRY